jgi:hypothetical protein
VLTWCRAGRARLLLLVLQLQALRNSSYAAAAKTLSHALQRYARQRHPYQRAADEIELAVASAAVAEAAEYAAEEQQGSSGVNVASAADVAGSGERDSRAFSNDGRGQPADGQLEL